MAEGAFGNDSADLDEVLVVELVAAAALRHPMVGMRPPRGVVFWRRETDQRNSLTVLGGERLDLPEAGHFLGQLDHLLREWAVDELPGAGENEAR